MKTISLCMIVKNESHVIERCLDSVKNLIDYVFIQDTGSTDNTIGVIYNWLYNNGIQGEVIQEPWQNFAYNRSLSLSRLKQKEFIDYALMIDADEILVFDEGFDPLVFKSSMDKDLYDIVTNMGGITYNRPQLSSNKLDFRYEGVVHEFLAGSFTTRTTADGFYNQPLQDSDRNRSGNKFENDVIVLKKALEETEDEWFKSRYTFYLAQSLRDLQRRKESLEYYLKRANMGFWQEEVYISYLNAANLMKELDYPHSEILTTYLKGQESVPTRLECLHGAIQLCRLIGMNQLGYILGSKSISIIKPQNGLFLENWIYDYAILDEFSIVSFWAGHFDESKLACEKLLQDNKIPEHYRERIKGNLQFALDRLK